MGISTKTVAARMTKRYLEEFNHFFSFRKKKVSPLLFTLKVLLFFADLYGTNFEVGISRSWSHVNYRPYPIINIGLLC